MIIKRFEDWQLADNYLTQDSELKNTVDKYKVKSQEIHEKDAKELAEAATSTIKCLSVILEQKDI